MPRRNVIVGVVQEIGRLRAAEESVPEHLADATEVTFGDGQLGRLNPADTRSRAWLSALGQLSGDGLPAYVEVDPDTREITELLVPIAVTVGELRELETVVEVELIISQARHIVSRNNPDFEELTRQLEQAHADGSTVLVTETRDEHEIIDVRSPPAGMSLIPLQVADQGDVAALAAPVSMEVARRMFALVNGLTCCSAAPTAPGIPFTYPDDGCWGRAHEMYRVMSASGVASDKVWIYGNLQVVSANKPDCTVRWGWHVAPTLPVTTAAGVATYVLDPALFAEPVPRATWAGVQGDPNPTLVPSSGEVFHRGVNGAVVLDPTYSQTNSVLTTYRARLQVRSASEGPPPYPQCQTRLPRVQWFGSVDAGATKKWFTFGWPATWHVLWTIMPTSICPGAPQLSWSVAVERANNAQCTYWISVRNLTSRPVRFEGRYDVLAT
jgi:hypothetical protein